MSSSDQTAFERWRHFFFAILDGQCILGSVFVSHTFIWEVIQNIGNENQQDMRDKITEKLVRWWNTFCPSGFWKSITRLVKLFDIEKIMIATTQGYRPISVLCNVSKVFQNLVCDVIFAHVNDSLKEWITRILEATFSHASIQRLS